MPVNCERALATALTVATATAALIRPPLPGQAPAPPPSQLSYRDARRGT